MKQRIVLVDDDRNITTSVAMALEAEGFAVDAYNDSEKGLGEILAHPPALAVLDIKMPRLTGMEMLKKIRETSNLPVVLLTSVDGEIDQFLGLRTGADDYITKPFSQRLLIERIRAVLRRHGPPRGEGAAAAKKSAGLGLSLDDEKCLCKWKNRDIDLTVTEYLIVRCLGDNAGNVKSRGQIMDAAYGQGVYAEDRTIDSHIKRIRRKFRDQDPAFDAIEAVYGLGYRFKDG